MGRDLAVATESPMTLDSLKPTSVLQRLLPVVRR